MAQRRFGPWHEVPRQREAGLQRSLEFHRGRGKVGGVATVLVATRGLLNFLRGEKKNQLWQQYRGTKGKTQMRGKTRDREFQARRQQAHSEGKWESTAQLWENTRVSSVKVWGRVKSSGGRSTGKGRPGLSEG